jgi:hypothetical protein
MARSVQRDAAIRKISDYKDAAHARINVLDGHARLAFFRSTSSKTPPARHDGVFLVPGSRYLNLV